jgi:hypothetical protein
MPDRSMDTIPSSLVRDRIGNRLHVRVLYSIYARGVWINRLIYLRSPEEHGAAPLVQPHGNGIDCCHCIGTTGRLHGYGPGNARAQGFTAHLNLPLSDIR